jgi:hypothetical protein
MMTMMRIVTMMMRNVTTRNATTMMRIVTMMMRNATMQNAKTLSALASLVGDARCASTA